MPNDHETGARPLAEASSLSLVDAIYERIARDEHIPGLVAGVVRDGKLAHLTAIGVADLKAPAPVGPTTSFRIASMTKNVVALAILKLRDEGRLILDAPVADYAPEFAAVALPTADSRPVIVRDLLCHLGGFVTDDPWGDRQLGIAPETFDRMIAEGGLFAQPPEVAFEYSNLGYALLGRVITRVTGRPYQEAVRDMLLTPLGMSATTFDVFALPEQDRATGYRWTEEGWSAEAAEPDGEFGAMGGLTTCAVDYAAYVAFLLRAWPPRDGEDGGPVRRASVRELGVFHAQPTAYEVLDEDQEPHAVASAYGAGMTSSIDGVLGRYLHHAGGLPGYASHVLLSPEAGIGVFAFANRTYAPMGRANWLAAAALKRAGLWAARPVPLSRPLAAAMGAVVEAFNAGRIEKAVEWLSDNLLADEPAERRDAEIARLLVRFGQARLKSLTPRHALAGRFVLTCQRGDVGGEILLTPGSSPKIQRLSFVEPSPPARAP